MSDDFVGAAVTLTVPHSEMFPEELHGRFVAAMLLGHLAGEDAAKRELRRVRRWRRSRCSRWA